MHRKIEIEIKKGWGVDGWGGVGWRGREARRETQRERERERDREGEGNPTLSNSLKAQPATELTKARKACLEN